MAAEGATVFAADLDGGNAAGVRARSARPAAAAAGRTPRASM
jgi:hypothetical protein